jgi:hypothetical protein
LDFIDEHFNTSDIKTLCLGLDVDYESLAGETKKDKARELILHLKRIHKLDRLYDVLTDYVQKMNMSQESIQQLRTLKDLASSIFQQIYLTDIDPGEKQKAMRQQLVDIGQALQCDVKKEIEVNNEGVKMLMKTKTTNQEILMSYVPNIEQQKLRNEVLASYGLFWAEKKGAGMLKGRFFTLASIDPSLLDLSLGDDFQVYGGSDVVNLLATIYKISSTKEVREKLAGGPLRNGPLSLIYYRLEYYWFVMSDDRTRLTLLNGVGEAMSQDYAKPILLTIVNLIGGNAEGRYVDLTKIGKAEEMQMQKFKPSVAKQQDKSNSWFDYLLPSHPDFFVGRNKEIQDVFVKIDEIQQNSYPGRGIVIEGASGSGKSSFIFKMQSQRDKINSNCFIYSVDSRGCFGPDFLGVVFEDFLRRIRNWEIIETLNKQYLMDLLEEARPFTDSKSITFTTRYLSRMLKEDGLIVLLCFDQFEYLVPYPSVVGDIANLLENVNLQKSNIVIGVISRTDMNLPQFSDFPFDFWSRIQKQSWHLQLGPLDNAAEQHLIAKMQDFVGKTFRKEFLDEILQFSQGRPWVLKHVGAHLVSKYKEMPQKTPTKLELRLEELFAEDLRSLNDYERRVLKAIAKTGPATISEIKLEDGLSQEGHLKIVDALVDGRLISKIGEKYDIYHDRFKEYILKQMLDPNEKLRFEIQTTLRAGRFMMGGVQGYLMLIMTAPNLILESNTNKPLCLEVSQEIADRFYFLGQQDRAVQRIGWLQTESQNKDDFTSNCCLTAYKMYSILSKQSQTSEQLLGRKRQILELIIQTLGKTSSNTLVEETIGRLDEIDLEECQDRLMKLMNRQSVIIGMIKGFINCGSITKLNVLLDNEYWPKEDRLRINIEATKYLISVGRIEETELLYEQIISTINEISNVGDSLQNIRNFEHTIDDIKLEIAKYWSLKADINKATQYLDVSSELGCHKSENTNVGRKSFFDSSHQLKYWIAVGLVKSRQHNNKLTFLDLEKSLGFELSSYHSTIIKLLLLPDEAKFVPYVPPTVIHDIAVGYFLIGDMARAEIVINSSNVESDKIGNRYLQSGTERACNYHVQQPSKYV